MLSIDPSTVHTAEMKFLLFTAAVFAISISTAPRQSSEVQVSGMPPCLKCHNGGCCPYNWPICCLNSKICGKSMLGESRIKFVAELADKTMCSLRQVSKNARRSILGF